MSKILNSTSNKNIFILLIGTGTAQAIPVIASLILTRIYTPEEYGLLAIFTSIVTILGSVITLRYELAILVPIKEEDAVNVTVLSMIFTIGMSILTFIFFVIFKEEILSLLNIKNLGNWLYFVPLAILFMGLYNSLNYLATRVGIFKTISKTKVYQAFSGSLSQIILGLMQFGTGGLVIGTIISHFTGNLKLISSIKKEKYSGIKNINLREISFLAKKYSNYPKYSVPSTIFNNVSIQMMSFIIPAFFSASLLGQYSLSQRIVISPMKVIGNSITQVFLNEASLELKESNSASKSFISTFKKLFFISVPLYLFIFIIIEDLMTVAFGETWQVAGKISKILIVLLFFRFVVNPLSNVLNLYEKQRIVLIWQISLVLLTFFSLIVSVTFNLGFYSFLKLYVSFLSLDYIIMFFICLYFSKKQK